MKATVVISYLLLSHSFARSPETLPPKVEDTSQNFRQVPLPPVFRTPIPAIIVPSPAPIEDAETSALWNSLEGIIPGQYYKVATNNQLYKDAKFIAAMFNLVLYQISLEMDTMYAKQVVFNRYLDCACRPDDQVYCRREEPVSSSSSNDFRQLLTPYFAKLDPNVDFGIAIRMLKYIRYNLEQSQLRHRHLAESVQCYCPRSAACDDDIDQEVYSIVVGTRDNYLNSAYWQGIFSGVSDFPKLIPDEIFLPLLSAWNSLLQSIFGGSNTDQSKPLVWGWFGHYDQDNTTSSNTTETSHNTFVSGLFALVASVIFSGRNLTVTMEANEFGFEIDEYGIGESEEENYNGTYVGETTEVEPDELEESENFPSSATEGGGQYLRSTPSQDINN